MLGKDRRSSHLEGQSYNFDRKILFAKIATSKISRQDIAMDIFSWATLTTDAYLSSLTPAGTTKKLVHTIRDSYATDTVMHFCAARSLRAAMRGRGDVIPRPTLIARDQLPEFKAVTTTSGLTLSICSALRTPKSQFLSLCSTLLPLFVATLANLRRRVRVHILANSASASSRARPADSSLQFPCTVAYSAPFCLPCVFTAYASGKRFL